MYAVFFVLLALNSNLTHKKYFSLINIWFMTICSWVWNFKNAAFCFYLNSTCCIACLSSLRCAASTNEWFAVNTYKASIFSKFKGVKKESKPDNILMMEVKKKIEVIVVLENPTVKTKKNLFIAKGLLYLEESWPYPLKVLHAKYLPLKLQQVL